MKILLLFVGITLINPAFAAPKKRAPNSNSEGQTAHVLQMDEDFPIEALRQEGVVVHPLSEVGSHSEVLPANVEEELFQESGLGALVKDWDGFDKDRLALRAEKQDPKEVAARYEGRIPEASIRKLKRLIEEFRRSHQ